MPLPIPQMMQGAGAPPMPPTMGAPPAGGTGGAVMPSAMGGAAAKSEALVKTAVEQLQSALPGLAMGSEVHNAVLKAVSEISKHLGKGPDDQSQIVQQLAELARSRQQNPAQQQSIARLFPQNPVAGVSPGARPPPAEAA